MRSDFSKEYHDREHWFRADRVRARVFRRTRASRIVNRLANGTRKQKLSSSSRKQANRAASRAFARRAHVSHAWAASTRASISPRALAIGDFNGNGTDLYRDGHLNVAVAVDGASNTQSANVFSSRCE